ncbi:MAG: IclR family transcriptional regulator [Pseudomonadota bacterium]
MTTQTLERAVGLLRLLASAGAEGRRLADLHVDSGLTKPTVHRILDSLRNEGLVEQTGDTRRYRLGKELAVLGWSAGRTVYDLKDLAADEMAAVATETGDTSFLSIRTGNEAVCIDRQTGDYPVKAFTVEVGMRRPLGVGATGVALLASLSDDKINNVLKLIEGPLGRYPNASLRQIRDAVTAARATGYALSEGLMVKGVRGVAVTILDGDRQPVAAIGMASINDRMGPKRLPEIVRALKMYGNRIEQRIAAAESSRSHGSTRVVRGKAGSKMSR